MPVKTSTYRKVEPTEKQKAYWINECAPLRGDEPCIWCRDLTDPGEAYERCGVVKALPKVVGL